ncbi:nuclease-like protein [Actinomycetospora cinnamomea]|uniref:Nuclease-like protein n=1 Tax=Actinomycetospora cinnamomea TaxID=663609 RepID=A0A2U1FRT5_9PSEU|nr:nuclease-like protein [Actinomycetospora cinnamomea]
MVREQQPWLDVPYAEKDEARAAGARWDWRAKRWYAPRPGMAELERWLPVPRPAPDAAAGDRPLHSPGPGAAQEAAAQGDVGDDSRRAGAEGEVRLAEALRGLTEPTVLARLTRRRPPWRVLHAVPVGIGRRDVDHVLLGPPGVVTVTTAHHAGRLVRVDGDHLTVDRLPTAHVPRARAEAERAGRLLAAARGGGDEAVPPVTAALAVVAASVTTAVGGHLPGGVLVATPARLPRLVTALPAVLADVEIDELYAVARRLSTWTREV